MRNNFKKIFYGGQDYVVGMWFRIDKCTGLICFIEILHFMKLAEKGIKRIDNKKIQKMKNTVMGPMV